MFEQTKINEKEAGIGTFLKTILPQDFNHSAQFEHFVVREEVFEGNY